MPLVQGYSEAAIAENIARERRAGRDGLQAIAIAMETARRAWRRHHPRGRYPMHLAGMRKPHPRKTVAGWMRSRNRSAGTDLVAPTNATSGLEFDAFNTALAKALGRLKKDAQAETIRQNYKGTGSKKAVRQIWVRFKNGAVIDLWLEHGYLGFAGVVARGGATALPKGIPYRGQTVEQVYQETLAILQPWANPMGLANQAAVQTHPTANRARHERLAKPLDTRTLARVTVGRVIGYVEYDLSVWVAAATQSEATVRAARYGRVMDVFTDSDPNGTRHATAIAETKVVGFTALQRATEGIDRYLLPNAPGSPYSTEVDRATFLRAAKKRPPWYRDAAGWRAATAER